jgi:hypothetical protein
MALAWAKQKCLQKREATWSVTPIFFADVFVCAVDWAIQELHVTISVSMLMV